jgi:hypothetical protein
MREVHPTLQVQLCVHRDVTLRVGRAEIHAHDALLAPDRAEDIQTDVDVGFRDADQVEPAPHAKHGEALFGHQFQSDEIKDVIRPSGQKVAHGLRPACSSWSR